MSFDQAKTIAVIGAGIAGAWCAHTLNLAGHSVHVFDKSRGPGGRLATRRVEWVDHNGQAHTTRIDHGAVGLTASPSAFRSFVDHARNVGWLDEWAPELSAESLPLEDGNGLVVPVPDMPALCRHLLNGISFTWSLAIEGLHKGPLGWELHSSGERRNPAAFDAVVLAVPPSQAAPLLEPHRYDWSQHASAAPMDPCWTMMGIAQASDSPLTWDLARPSSGPLEWHHAVVHRWRYARPMAQKVPAADSFWWDAALGLGVCGDFFARSGVEGAWLSAQSLTAAMLHEPRTSGG